ncbi:uncharacterized protein LOC142338546 [Convolutriloba macropyga]|uniref:uncharacterized protein LOC142338546 n=1 Tax=Convolutriloba macropyga TaxID=536237 RepID=UPI003F51E081
MLVQNGIVLFVVATTLAPVVWANECTSTIELSSGRPNSSTVIYRVSDDSGLPVKVIDYECLDRSRQNVISCPGNILLSGEFSIDDLVYVAGLLPGQFVDWVPKVVEVQGEGNKTGCPGFAYVCTRVERDFDVIFTDTPTTPIDGLTNITINDTVYESIFGYQFFHFKWNGSQWITERHYDFTDVRKTAEMSVNLVPGVVNSITVRTINQCRSPVGNIHYTLVPGAAAIMSADVLFTNDVVLCVIWEILHSNFMEIKLIQEGNVVSDHSKSVSASAAGVTCLDLGSNVNTSLDAFVEVYAFSNHTYQDGNFIENENVAPNITVDFTTNISVFGTFECNDDRQCLLHVEIQNNLSRIESSAYFVLRITSCSNLLVGEFRHNFKDICNNGSTQNTHECSVTQNRLNEKNYDVQVGIFDGVAEFLQLNLTSGEECDGYDDKSNSNRCSLSVVLVVLSALIITSTSE